MFAKGGELAHKRIASEFGGPRLLDRPQQGGLCLLLPPPPHTETGYGENDLLENGDFFSVQHWHARWLTKSDSRADDIQKIKLRHLHATPVDDVGTLSKRIVAGCETIWNFPGTHKRIRVSVRATAVSQSSKVDKDVNLKIIPQDNNKPQLLWCLAQTRAKFSIFADKKRQFKRKGFHIMILDKIATRLQFKIQSNGNKIKTTYNPKTISATPETRNSETTRSTRRRGCEASSAWSSAGVQGRVKRESPEKTHRPAASCGTIPICENPEEVGLTHDILKSELSHYDKGVASGTPDTWEAPATTHRARITRQVHAAHPGVDRTPASPLHFTSQLFLYCHFCTLTRNSKGRDGVVVRLYSVNRVRLPAGPPSDFGMWEWCRTMPLVGRFSRPSPVSPAFAVRRWSILTSLSRSRC
ncbi:hypothetical protein PR048_004425 [Dryococelus australis]|uniref:Uncharacterized protein n=1 Tax=Dryococelus australis TaxID=614101 RepID=A0ABQ9I5E6_9NEOP|nr:hypothetical protein PR048_004425 [Dryococelus australis]